MYDGDDSDANSDYSATPQTSRQSIVTNTSTEARATPEHISVQDGAEQPKEEEEGYSSDTSAFFHTVDEDFESTTGGNSDEETVFVDASTNFLISVGPEDHQEAHDSSSSEKYLELSPNSPMLLLIEEPEEKERPSSPEAIVASEQPESEGDSKERINESEVTAEAGVSTPDKTKDNELRRKRGKRAGWKHHWPTVQRFPDQSVNWAIRHDLALLETLHQVTPYLLRIYIQIVYQNHFDAAWD